ncbi:MAG: sterol desaturase family protein [Maricaulaceae bacterium]|jgi:sterol desaturase/sphingolipid hydroxylase (fatty acid hydroxylase superfamily)
MAETIPNPPDPILFAIPFFVAFVVMEMVYGRITGRAKFEPRDSATSLIMGLGNTVFGGLLGAIAAGWALWVYQFRVFDLGFALWVWVFAFVADDFLYYWSHRMAHRVRWFWADHVVHHSSQHYNLTTALRQPWFSTLTFKFVIFATPLALLGVHPVIVGFVSALNLIYQFWIHTEAINKTPGWFEAVMNTPSHHRVHHATNPRYLDKNYAGVFIVWDRMFGTFVPEREDDPCRYGIVKNLGTFNPLRVSVHEFVGIARDVAGAKTWKDRLAFVFAPPGWSPDGSRDTSDIIKARWRAAESDADATPAE